MRLNKLTITGFRDLRVSLDSVPETTILLVGSNAQGKTSVLEAIYFLSTLTSFQTSSDRQLINFNALDNLPAVARVTAEFEKNNTKHSIEARVILENTGAGARVRKEILIDGVKRPPASSIGIFSSILFTPKMFSILETNPETRRRYLNLTLAQGIPSYAKTLSHYNRTVTQRNALLKRLQENNGDVSELLYWNDQLCESASKIIHWRSTTLNTLGKQAKIIHTEISDELEDLALDYQPALHVKTSLSPAPLGNELEDPATIKALLTHSLRSAQRAEIARGVTLIGPHRDELRMTANGVDLGNFGSRGQVKTALLSLKLAEYQWLSELSGESPVILLDEIMSEIDTKRRVALMNTLSTHQQAFLTTTDADIYSKDFVAHSTVWRIDKGVIDHNAV